MIRVPTILSLLLFATATLEAQTTILASVSTQGAQYGQTKDAVISPDGRYVAFTTFTGASQEIYVRDLIQATTTLASSSSTGVPSGYICRAPSFCGDGHLLAFQSWSSTLIPGDTNGVPDIFVKDLNTGAITRVSVGPAGGESNSFSDWPAMSDDGRYVAFQSYATNLVSGFGASGVGSVYRYDRLTGTTVAVSVSTAGGQPAGVSNVPSISADGRFVAFQSDAPVRWSRSSRRRRTSRRGTCRPRRSAW
jgi:Tol biopolymer transport system component